MGLCFVEGVDRDFAAVFSGVESSVFRRPLPRTKNGIFLSSVSASDSQITLSAVRRLGGAAAVVVLHAAPMMAGPGRVVELEIIAEHVQQVFFQPHDQRMNPCVKMTLAPSNPSAANSVRGNPAHARGRK